MRLVSRAVLLLAPVIASAAGLHPACAQQTSISQEFDDIRNSIGLGKERPPVDFSERAPLVVPPTYNLPPPGGADPDQLSITDPDIAARRRALADPRRPVPSNDPGATATGRASRTYLIDPPSGLRDPARVAADITHDTAPAASTKHAHARHHKKAKSAPE